MPYLVDTNGMWRRFDPADPRQPAIKEALNTLLLAGETVYITTQDLPKLLFRDVGELAILRRSHLFPGHESAVLSLIGLGEILFGCLLVCRWQSRLLLHFNILLLVVLGVGAVLSQPHLFVAPFNPLTLNLAMAALSAAGLWSAHDLPSARSCRRKRPEKQT